MKMTALKPLNCTVVPYHILELPIKKTSHPYVVDMIVEKNYNSESSLSDTELMGRLITTVCCNNNITVVECKKTVLPSFIMLELSDVIELLI